MSTKIDSQYGQKVVAAFKQAHELLDTAVNDIQAANSKLAAERRDQELAAPIIEVALQKLSSIVIDGERLADPNDLPQWREGLKTKHGMAQTLADLVATLEGQASSGSKTAGDLGLPSDAQDPYQVAGNTRASGFASLPRTRSFM
jgi:hypothetical protein